jgi:alkylation response protein AidB-like acyl-CoA dehydrogenase
LGLTPIVSLRESEEQRELRRDVRSWLAQRMRPEFTNATANPDYFSEGLHRKAVDFCRTLHGRGWFVPHWPAQFEGGGLGIVEQVVIREELAYAGAPLVNTNGVNMLAPILFRFGTSDQKERHLPAIARSEVMWAQGYSEPDAGSDLASLRMRARPTWNGYVLSGQKAWTSNGRLADWIFVLARTDPDRPRRQDGLTFFLVDLKSPGITVNPVRSLTGYPTFADEFFDDVYVPRENLVGEENNGWKVAKALLDVERSNITRAAQAQRYLDELIDWCRQQEGSDHDPLQDPVKRLAIARLVERVEVGRALCYRIAHLQAAGTLQSAHASLAKLYNAELAAEVRDVGARILGMAGELAPDSPGAVLHGHFTEGLLLSLLHRIGGGTSEIQRDVIATSGLGLPR